MAKREIASVDTSFWVHAGMVRAHPELLSEFDVTVTRAVSDELGVGDRTPSSVSGQALQLALLSGTARALDPGGPLIPEFHAGEKAVLSLATEQMGDLIPLIDETKAYQWAVKKGLPVMSVPLWLAMRTIRLEEDPMVAVSKIKALVQGRHISMLLAHEPLALLAVHAARMEGRS
ncbi:MAG TPA: hypothetical protein V6D00_15520 [Pantanalinema sp.]